MPRRIPGSGSRAHVRGMKSYFFDSLSNRTEQKCGLVPLTNTSPGGQESEVVDPRIPISMGK